jgi:hypothetical protein
LPPPPPPDFEDRSLRDGRSRSLDGRSRSFAVDRGFDPPEFWSPDRLVLLADAAAGRALRQRRRGVKAKRRCYGNAKRRAKNSATGCKNSDSLHESPPQEF